MHVLTHLFLCSIYFVKLNVPETKGLTLEQIEQKFQELRRNGGPEIAVAVDMEPLLDTEAARYDEVATNAEVKTN